MQPYRDFARQHRLQLWEDCAQAFTGDMGRGHPESDAVFFSFGPIKTATALGGGAARFRDAEVGARVRAILALSPRQPTTKFAARVAKYAGIKFLGSSPRLYAWLVRVADACGGDHDVWVTHWTRGSAILARERPCAAQLALMWRRLRRFDASQIEARRALGRRLQAAVGGAALMGSGQNEPTFWLMPVLSPRPRRLRQRLVRAGFDATLGSSKMRAHRSGPPVPTAARLMRQVVYVPLYVGLDDRDVENLCERLQGFFQARSGGREDPCGRGSRARPAASPYGPSAPTCAKKMVTLTLTSGGRKKGELRRRRPT